MASDKGVPVEVLAKLKEDFNSNKKNLLAQNVFTKYDVFDVCTDRSAFQGTRHVYNRKVKKRPV